MESANVSLDSRPLKASTSDSRDTNTAGIREHDHPSHSTANRRRSKPRRYYELKIRLFKIAVMVGAIAMLVTVLLSGVFISALSRERNQLRFELERQRSELQSAHARLEQVQEQRDSLVQGRIPELSVLEYDKTIPIGRGYVRNVTYTLLREGSDQAYEYRLVLHNDSLSVVHPVVSLFLFDERGIQIGMADIEQAETTAEVTRAMLDPGEVRSYSGRIRLIRGETPQYFLVAID